MELLCHFQNLTSQKYKKQKALLIVQMTYSRHLPCLSSNWDFWSHCGHTIWIVWIHKNISLIMKITIYKNHIKYNGFLLFRFFLKPPILWSTHLFFGYFNCWAWQTPICIQMTDDAVITALNTVLTQLDNDNTSGRMLLDFSSACNTVILHKLTEKPSNLGLGSSLCMWKRDFLSNHAKNAQMGMYTLSTLILNTGTPQGCVLSPLLYSILTRLFSHTLHWHQCQNRW